MAVQTFNPTDLSQSATNWAVAQRIVGPFAPHAQVTPNLTLALDPGFLLSGTTLTEVNAQNVGPFAPPSSGFRIDRVVIDRSTGAASIVTGTANSLTPPAIPTGKLPVARVMLQATTDAITNAVIVDERALFDLAPPTSPTVICRATLNNVDQTGVSSSTNTRINFTAAPINVGSGFDLTNHYFKPSIPGYYNVYAQVATLMNTTGNNTQINMFLNGTGSAVGVTYYSGATAYYISAVSDVLHLNGTTDYVEAFAIINGSAGAFYGSTGYTFFKANLVG